MEEETLERWSFDGPYTVGQAEIRSYELLSTRFPTGKLGPEVFSQPSGF